MEFGFSKVTAQNAGNFPKNELTPLQVFFKDFHQKFRNNYLREQL